MSKEILVETIVLKKATAYVLDDVHGYSTGEALEGRGFTIRIADSFHIMLQLFDILRKWELFG